MENRSPTGRARRTNEAVELPMKDGGVAPASPVGDRIEVGEVSTARVAESALEISVVVPVYGCRECLLPLHQRLTQTLRTLTSRYEIILVDDASPDESWETIKGMTPDDPAIRAFRLSRNFGQQAAITAGLAQARGRYTVVMDCDLQESPEDIPRLYAKALEGFDIVMTKRARRQGTRRRRHAGRAYFKLRNFLLGTNVDLDTGTLSLLSSKVVSAFLQLGDRDREYSIVLHWLGFRQATVETSRSPRHEGRSSYTVSRLMRLSIDGMFFQTSILLRWIVSLGFLVALAGALLALYYIYSYVVSDPLPGYTSLAVLLLGLSGFIIVSLGVVGLYVGRIFEQVKGRPLYVIDQHVEYESGTHQVEGTQRPQADSASPPG